MINRRGASEDVQSFCFDLKEVKHTVEVSAGSVYEAVAQALRIFRDNNWVEDIGHGQTPITVKVKHPEIEHMVRVQDFERWLEASPRSPAEMMIARAAREGQVICVVDSP
jgi:hypothetical protein